MRSIAAQHDARCGSYIAAVRNDDTFKYNCPVIRIGCGTSSTALSAHSARTAGEYCWYVLGEYCWYVLGEYCWYGFGFGYKQSPWTVPVRLGRLKPTE